MSRYVAVVQIEIDDSGRLCVLPDENGRMENRNMENLQKPIPFIRYGIVDRARKNRTVYSGFDMIDVVETCRVFNTPLPSDEAQPKSLSGGEQST